MDLLTRAQPRPRHHRAHGHPRAGHGGARAAHRPLRRRARRARPPQRGGRTDAAGTPCCSHCARIRRNLLRSFLTVLGIVIGVAAVITMVTLGNGATQSVTDQISEHGQQPADRRSRASASGPARDGAAAASRARTPRRSRNQITAAERVAPIVSTGGDGGLPGQELVHRRDRAPASPTSWPATGRSPRAAPSPRPRSAPARPCA